MSNKSKIKGEALYQRLRAERERLVKKYKAGGTIRFDEAIGLIPVGGNPAVSTAPTTLGGALVVNTGRREKRVVDIREDGTVASANGRVVLDLDAIKAANIADGVASGTMLDALKTRAEGKTVLLFANDAALRYGTVILGEVECMLQLQNDITAAIRNAIFPGFSAVGGASQGLIHALPGLVENETLTHRGLVKPTNYRGDVEYLKDPVSLWSVTDISRQSIMLFGVNSEIRMWGKNQVIDLNGKRIGAHERPNRIAAFSSIIDLSDGHFASLSTKGARNAHIFSSTGVGRLARNNHFAIRGHFCKEVLVEGIMSGDANTLNHGSYFGTAIFNDSSEIVFKDVHQEMLNKAVANSSLALSHYAQLVQPELVFGYFERPSTWNSTGSLACPWMKWLDKAAGDLDTFGNNKTTRFPVIKTANELLTAMKAGSVLADAEIVKTALEAMYEAYKKGMKSADDTYIQVNTGHGIIGKTFPMVNNIATATNQIPRSVNLVAQNPRNDEGVRYPDSVAYGFRVGSSLEGVGKLATERGGTVQDIYILDCSFSGNHLSPMEAISMGTPDKGLFKTFNGMGIRPLGYTNAITDTASMAPAAMLISKDEMEDVIPASRLEEKPVDSFDTAAAAVANYIEMGGDASDWTARKASGLYKGNDMLEPSLAALEAIGLLKKYFTGAAAQAQLSGTDNSNIDIGLLAWRKSMMMEIDALTANMVGLKGGNDGDIFITDPSGYDHGEIYPWFVSTDKSVVSDKDDVLSQADARTNRLLTLPYLSKAIPAPSFDLMKLKLISSDTLALVRCDASETPVTYEECATLLGFGSGTGPVTYKLVRNVDGQNHVHKGSFGVRIDSAADFNIEKVVIKDHKTADAKKETKAIGSVETQLAFGVNEASEPESGVNKIRGISINGCTEGSIEDIFVSTLDSKSMAVAVEIRGKSSDIDVENVRAEKIIAEDKAVGLKVTAKTSEIVVKKVRAEELDGAHPGVSLPVEIESEDVKLN
jgi:hypothetical protein